MRPVTIGLAVALSAVLAHGEARAEFQLSTAPPPTTQSAVVPDRAAERVPERAPRASRPPAIPVARGFGTGVPLAFAVRQVLPSGVKASFAPGVDAEGLLVDWKGGRPWPEVLRSLLRPAHLQVTFRPGSVLIERWTRG
jgi:hypothetical protein